MSLYLLLMTDNPKALEDIRELCPHLSNTARIQNPAENFSYPAKNPTEITVEKSVFPGKFSMDLVH